MGHVSNIPHPLISIIFAHSPVLGYNDPQQMIGWKGEEIKGQRNCLPAGIIWDGGGRRRSRRLIGLYTPLWEC